MKSLCKFISFFLSVLLICSAVFPVSVSADTYREYGGFIFKYLSNDSVSISKYKGEDATMVIPDTLLNVPVSSIEENAFHNDNFVEHIVFGKYFTNLSPFCFADSTALMDVTFPDTLKYIGFSAFQGCSALTSVDFAKSDVNVVSDFSFNNCSVLYEVILNNNVTEIKQMAFADNPSLNRIYIPPSVTVIDESAFYNTSDFTVYCYSDSYAFEYAVEHNLDYFLLDTIDKSELETTIKSADEMLNIIDMYIPSSVANFNTAYEIAVSTYNSPFSTEEDLKSANNILFNVMNSMEQHILGDVDFSGNINVRDATSIQLYCADYRHFSDGQLIIADIDGDGVTTIKDATTIQLIIAKLI